ncbi:MAG TPA: 4-carboxy-4-hydroxy-2-oxoadipate aldolase/oxaloacetate decarboxylase [Trueperaceae bacterium]
MARDLRAICERLAELGVATVYEAAGRQGLIDCDLVQLLPGSRVAGPARTVSLGQSDNLMAHAVIERIQPGDVVVLAMPAEEPVGLIGELLVTQIQKREAAAVLSNGAMRDVEELEQMGLPIWSRFIRAKGATKKVPGALDVPVVLGGTTIEPGDVIVLDADGATCVPEARLDEVLEKSEARLERETAMRKRLQDGEMSIDIHGLREAVERV